MIRPIVSPRRPMAVALTIFLTACASNADRIPGATPRPSNERVEDREAAPIGTDPVLMYGEKTDAGFHIAGVNTGKMNPAFVRQVVSYATDEKPGTIIVDQRARFLYLIQPGGKAICRGCRPCCARLRWWRRDYCAKSCLASLDPNT